MSFDSILMPLEHGVGVLHDCPEARVLLGRNADTDEPESTFARLGFPDGGTDVFGVPTEGAPFHGLMFNHSAGHGAFDFMVQVAQLTDSVIVPAGCGTSLVAESQREHLPDELRRYEAGVGLVTSGTELLEVIEAGNVRVWKNGEARA